MLDIATFCLSNDLGEYASASVNLDLRIKLLNE
jgi:hypothetical protein